MINDNAELTATTAQAFRDGLEHHVGIERLHTELDEADLAAPLNQVVADFRDVEIGSYPRWSADPKGRLRCVVRVTFEAIGAQRHLARDARDALARALGPHNVLTADPANPEDP